mmetsp:Transcript_30321/g.55406  ORF Transcript_30321/g.55406 Transcript_30321/m.55406 type:complete len:135 (-) Transcript_30321:338-742(-)
MNLANHSFRSVNYNKDNKTVYPICNKTLFSKRCVSIKASPLVVEKMAPLHDRVLVKPLPQEQKTASGLILTGSQSKANSDAHIGEVIAVGQSVDLNIQKGDFVVYQKYATAEIETNGSPIIFVAEKSIFAKLEN